MAIAIPVLDGLLKVGEKLIDRLIPDKEKAAEAKFKLLEMQQNGELAVLAADTELAKGQLEINKIEAENASLWVSGWRPAVGWVCVGALASQYIVGPLVEWVSAFGAERITWPIANNGELMTLLLGMLGLGVLRTTEKIKGVTK